MGNNTSLTVRLAENTKLLDEVVVTALGIKREEKALGYAVQKVDGDRLAAVKTVNVATSLTGKIAGLNVKNSTEFNTGSLHSRCVHLPPVSYRRCTLWQCGIE